MLSEVETYRVRIEMAGNLQTAEQLLRKECYPPNEGLCVTVTPTTFIYTGGQESGFSVGMINYPRFPTTKEALFTRAVVIAEKLIAELCQWSACVIADDKTVWINKRPADQR